MIPYIVLTLPLALFSQMLTFDESGTYSSILNAIYLWVAFLFLMKVKVLHDFQFGKVLWITFLTLLGMLIIWFVGFLIFGLVNQVIDFIIGVIKEIQFRL
jgi:hypothetical protein